MVRATMIVMCALVLALVAAPPASANDIKGTVIKIEQPAGVVVFDDGRMYQVTKETVMVVDNQPQPVVLEKLETGKPYVFRSITAVQLKDGKYVIIEEKSPSALPR